MESMRRQSQVLKKRFIKLHGGGGSCRHHLFGRFPAPVNIFLSTENTGEDPREKELLLFITAAFSAGLEVEVAGPGWPSGGGVRAGQVVLRVEGRRAEERVGVGGGDLPGCRGARP
jgi:hypothetical protein